MWRYIRAFFKALAMTLRGEKPTTPAQRMYPRLFTWLEAAQSQLSEVYAAADAAALDEAARQTVTVTIDGRETNMETLLGSVRHHLHEEYPYMLRHLTEHSLMGIYASNLNDQYWLTTLSAAETIPAAVRADIKNFYQHLNNIPPSNSLKEE